MPIIEILIITTMINYILSFLWNTKSMDLVVGFIAFLFILGVSSWLHLPVLHRIMILFGNVLAIAVIVIFQPELRMALSKLNLKRRKIREVTTFDRFLDQLSNSVYRLAEQKVGALIVLENEDSLQEYVQKSVVLNGEFSSELLETIFTTKTPLHDGAIIIRDQTILAAAVILPLIEDTSLLTKSMGTRHRAGLGMSQTTDAVVVIISEESGKVSIARDGVMTKGVKIDRFKGIIRSIFNADEQHDRKFKIMDWLKT